MRGLKERTPRIKPPRCSQYRSSPNCQPTSTNSSLSLSISRCG